MRVLSLHKLPFDESRLECDLEAVREQDDFPELARQYRENHKNAWIVVVEDNAPIDFDEFAHPEVDSNAQSPWLEQSLTSAPATARAAFFLHYVDPAKPLWYRGRPLPFPAITPAPDDLVAEMDYSSPD